MALLSLIGGSHADQSALLSSLDNVADISIPNGPYEGRAATMQALGLATGLGRPEDLICDARGEYLVLRWTSDAPAAARVAAASSSSAAGQQGVSSSPEACQLLQLLASDVVVLLQSGTRLDPALLVRLRHLQQVKQALLAKGRSSGAGSSMGNTAAGSRALSAALPASPPKLLLLFQDDATSALGPAQRKEARKQLQAALEQQLQQLFRKCWLPVRGQQALFTGSPAVLLAPALHRSSGQLRATILAALRAPAQQAAVAEPWEAERQAALQQFSELVRGLASAQQEGPKAGAAAAADRRPGGRPAAAAAAAASSWDSAAAPDAQVTQLSKLAQLLFSPTAHTTPEQQEQKEQEQKEPSRAEQCLQQMQQQSDVVAAYSRHKCEQCLSTAVQAYLKAVPPQYPQRVHVRALLRAQRLYDSLALGPARLAVARQLPAMCTAQWTDGRQLCSAMSLTGRPCVLPPHQDAPAAAGGAAGGGAGSAVGAAGAAGGLRGGHDSEIELLVATACGDRLVKLPDCFSLEQLEQVLQRQEGQGEAGKQVVSRATGAQLVSSCSLAAMLGGGGRAAGKARHAAGTSSGPAAAGAAAVQQEPGVEAAAAAAPATSTSAGERAAAASEPSKPAGAAMVLPWGQVSVWQYSSTRAYDLEAGLKLPGLQAPYNQLHQLQLRAAPRQQQQQQQKAQEVEQQQGQQQGKGRGGGGGRAGKGAAGKPTDVQVAAGAADAAAAAANPFDLALDQFPTLAEALTGKQASAARKAGGQAAAPEPKPKQQAAQQEELHAVAETPAERQQRAGEAWQAMLAEEERSSSEEAEELGLLGPGASRRQLQQQQRRLMRSLQPGQGPAGGQHLELLSTLHVGLEYANLQGDRVIATPQMLGAPEQGPPVESIAAAAIAAATAALATVRKRLGRKSEAGAGAGGAGAGGGHEQQQYAPAGSMRQPEGPSTAGAGDSSVARWLLTHDLPLFLDASTALGGTAPGAAQQHSPSKPAQLQHNNQPDIPLFDGDPPPRPMGLLQLQRIHIVNQTGSTIRFASRPTLLLKRGSAEGAAGAPGSAGGPGGSGGSSSSSSSSSSSTTTTCNLFATKELELPAGATVVLSLPLVLAVPVARQGGDGGEGRPSKWQLVPVVQTSAGRPFDAVLAKGSWLYPVQQLAAEE